MNYHDPPAVVRASLLADEGRETYRAIYPNRTPAERKHEPMRPVGTVRKMRQSRKRRKGE